MIEQGSDIFGNPYLLCFELETCVGMEKNTKNEQTQKVLKLKLYPPGNERSHIPPWERPENHRLKNALDGMGLC